MINQFIHRHALLFLCAAAMPAGAAETRFLAFGDSITIGHGDAGGTIICPDNVAVVGGYPPRLRPLLQARGIDAEFTNWGKCGEETVAGVTRIESALSGGGDVIIIMEGTNDVSERTGFESTVFNLNVMAQKAEDADVEPVLASIIPRGPEANTDTNNGKTNRIRLELRMDAAENGWAFADPFDVLFFGSPNFFELYYFDQLHPNPTGYGIIADTMVEAAVEAVTNEDFCDLLPSGPCEASDTTLCLNGGRFRLEVKWKNFQGGEGVGHAVPQTDDTGAFFWVDSQNIELAIKVLDGRANNDFFWVYYGALSNFEFTLAVKDTETGECKEYFNPPSTFASVGDIEAFHDPLPPP